MKKHRLESIKLNFQLQLRCASAAILSQHNRSADQFPIATAMRRPCDVQPSMYTGCICVSNSKLLFVQTDIYVITCVAGDSVLKTMGLYLNGASLFSLSPLTDRPSSNESLHATSVRYQNNDYSNYRLLIR
jgi:hypothetical protein